MGLGNKKVYIYTWRRTLTRSAGAATRVAGRALKAPAKASSGIDSACSVLPGLKEYTSLLPRS